MKYLSLLRCCRSTSFTSFIIAPPIELILT
nr:MAG TPA: hypothetical protein [Caudoviricetes sp.]